LSRLREIAAQRCKDWNGNGEADHVQLLVSLPPNLDLSIFVNNLKTTSSRLLRHDFREHLDQIYRRKPVLWVAVVLHYLMRRGSAFRDQVHRAQPAANPRW
jgi:putative transposase